MRIPVRTAGLALTLGMTIAGCAAGAEPTTTTSPEGTTTSSESNLGGDRLPVQVPGESYGHFASPINGELTMEPNGCWRIAFGTESRIIVFPEGFTKSEDGSAMTSADGVEFQSGSEIDAVGGLAPVQGLPGVPDGFWGNYLEFCDPTTTEIVVLDEVAAAFDPTSLSSSELVEMLRNAKLTESWGCGLGFTLASESQDAVLYVYPTDYEAVPAPPVTLPDTGWIAVVAVGKNLLVNHCDDVVEVWEPEPVVAAEWPITSGTLDFEPPTQSGFAACGAAGTVSATFLGVFVETPEGAVDLGDLTLVNEAYGCFAG